MKTSGFWAALTAVCAVTVIITAGASPARAEMNLSDGKWETTMEMTMEGMPFKMPPTKSSQCITKENAVPKGSEKQSNCKVLDQKVSGNTVSWKVKCVDKDMTTEGEGEVTYSGASYSGNMAMRMTDQKGKTQTAKMKMSGKRIGDCTEADRKEKENLKGQMEQAKAGQQELDVKTRRAEELAKLTVPEDGPGACMLSDQSCQSKFGKLNLMEGQWEITEEGTSTAKESAPPKAAKGKISSKTAEKAFYTPANLSTSTKCLLEQEALSYSQEQGCTKEQKRSGDRVTWNLKCNQSGTTVEEKGAINYNGTSYEGAKIRKMGTQAGETTMITKLSGRRTGDGTCMAVQRDSTFKKRGQSQGQAQKPAEVEAEKTPNPVKSLKKIFGF